MKKMILIMLLIFIVCILIQYTYLVENYQGNSNLLIIDRKIKLPPYTETLFTSDPRLLRDTNRSIYLDLLTSEYTLLDSKINDYKNTIVVDILTELEDALNKSKSKYVYIIGSRSNEISPNPNNMFGIWYNIAGEYVKTDINGVVYVYSALIQKKNIDDVDENKRKNDLTPYLEGWVREDLRKYTNSQPNIETIQRYAEEYSSEADNLCLHTNNSKIYRLDHLYKLYKNDTGLSARWKVTYKKKYLNGSPNWKRGIYNGIVRSELAIRVSNTYISENRTIKHILKAEHPYCGDINKIKVTAAYGYNIDDVDLYFGSNDSETKFPLPVDIPPLKTIQTIDLTIPVEMTHECAVKARRSIKRINGNTLELYQDKRQKSCELDELRKVIYENLVVKEVLIKRPYVVKPPQLVFPIPSEEKLITRNEDNPIIMNEEERKRERRRERRERRRERREREMREREEKPNIRNRGIFRRLSRIERGRNFF